MIYRFGMHFSTRDSSFSFIKYGARLFFARPFFKAQILFMIFFCTSVFSNNFQVGSFLVGIGLVLALAMIFLDWKNNRDA